MRQKIYEAPGFVKDEKSITSTDAEGLKAYRARKEQLRELTFLRKKVQELDERLAKLECLLDH